MSAVDENGKWKMENDEWKMIFFTHAALV